MESIKRLLVGIFMLIVGIAMFGFGIFIESASINTAGMVIFGFGLIYGVFGIFTK